MAHIQVTGMTELFVHASQILSNGQLCLSKQANEKTIPSREKFETILTAVCLTISYLVVPPSE